MIGAHAEQATARAAEEHAIRETLPNGQFLISHRNAFESVMRTAQLDAAPQARVAVHSSGGGCAGSWDLGYKMAYPRPGDRSSLEFDGKVAEVDGKLVGTVRALIVTNYSRRSKLWNEPRLSLNFGVDQFDAETEDLPPAARDALAAFVAGLYTDLVPKPPLHA